MEYNQDIIAKKIIDTLLAQRFETWYEGRFKGWIEGDQNGMKDEEVKGEIIRLFGLDRYK